MSLKSLFFIILTEIRCVNHTAKIFEPMFLLLILTMPVLRYFYRFDNVFA